MQNPNLKKGYKSEHCFKCTLESNPISNRISWSARICIWRSQSFFVHNFDDCMCRYAEYKIDRGKN